MKIVIIIAFLMGISISTFAEVYSYEGASSFDGGICGLSFDLNSEKAVIENMRLYGEFQLDDHIDSVVKTDNRINNDYVKESFKLKKITDSAWITKKILRGSGFRNRLKIIFEGESISELRAVQLTSDVGVLSYTIGLLKINCKGLKLLR